MPLQLQPIYNHNTWYFFFLFTWQWIHWFGKSSTPKQVKVIISIISSWNQLIEQLNIPCLVVATTIAQISWQRICVDMHGISYVCLCADWALLPVCLVCHSLCLLRLHIQPPFHRSITTPFFFPIFPISMTWSSFTSVRWKPGSRFMILPQFCLQPTTIGLASIKIECGKQWKRTELVEFNFDPPRTQIKCL